MRSYLLLFLLFLLQFFYLPIGSSFFEGSKVYAVEISIFLLLLLQIFSKEGIPLKNYNKRILLGAGILVGITIYHLLFQQTPTLLSGNAFRLQGTFLFWMLLIFALLSSRIPIEQKIKPIIIISILFVQLVSTLLFIGIGADRPVGTLGEPNALAATIIFIWPFLVFSWPKKVLLRMLSCAGLLAAFLIIFVSGSRSGIIAVGVQVSFLAALWILGFRTYIKDTTKRFISLCLAVIVLLGSLIVPFFIHSSEYEDRGEIWPAAIIAGAAHPIAGIGFGNAEYELHKANVKLHNHLPGYYVDSAHNIFLDWLIQTGVVGLAILLYFVINTFKTFIRKNQIKNIVLLLGLLAALSFNPSSVVSLVAFWWLIGQGFIVEKQYGALP